MKSHFRIPLCMAAALGFLAPIRATDITFEFNNAGVLPSSQGATYAGSISENTAFSVSGGILSQDTVTSGGGATAQYKVADVFDHSFDAVLEWSVQRRGGSGSDLGIQMFLIDDGFMWNFFIRDNDIAIHNGANFVSKVTMDTDDKQHTYKAVIPANSSSYDFYVDGVLKFSETAPTTAVGSLLLWGDSTPTGGNGKADWDFVRLSNPQVLTVPESASGLAFLAVCGAGMLLRRRIFVH